MRFPEIFSEAAGPVISFEVFPPKTEASMEQLRCTLPDLIALGPRYMTVTYGALGTTQERTLEIATLLRREYAVETACHLTCVGSSRSQIDGILGEIHRAGIENIVALRGDPPRGETTFAPPADGHAHANELVEHIRGYRPTGDFEGFGIAVAGYPEKHLEAPDMATDLTNLKRKVDAGADLVITQLFYDNADFFRFVESARAAGITQPIVPGLLPIVSAHQIRRITSLCGARIPDPLHAELGEAGDCQAKAEEIGVRQCIAQAVELLEAGVAGIHFYVLNRSAHMVRIMGAIRPVIANHATA